MGHLIDYKKSAEAELDALPQVEHKRVLKAIQKLALNPRPVGCKKLKSKDDLYRIRVGDYRVIYEIHDNVLIVIVVKVGHRQSVYRG